MQKKYSIGIFDSGFGGLTILKDIVKLLPQYNYIYLGDTARTPYGTRSQEIVFDFTRQAVEFLFKKNCWLIILACNTASSEALRKIQQGYLPAHFPTRRVLGVIIPTAEEAGQKAKRVGVIATEGSVNSGAFIRELRKINPELEIIQQACPLLVPIVEAGEQNSKAAKLILQNYLQKLLNKKLEALILGCTHYGLLENKIKKIFKGKVQIISEGAIVAKKLKDYLHRHPEIENLLGKHKKIKFFTTDLTDKFENLGSKFFGRKIAAEKSKLG